MNRALLPLVQELTRSEGKRTVSATSISRRVAETAPTVRKVRTSIAPTRSAASEGMNRDPREVVSCSSAARSFADSAATNARTTPSASLSAGTELSVSARVGVVVTLDGDLLGAGAIKTGVWVGGEVVMVEGGTVDVDGTITVGSGTAIVEIATTDIGGAAGEVGVGGRTAEHACNPIIKPEMHSQLGGDRHDPDRFLRFVRLQPRYMFHIRCYTPRTIDHSTFVTEFSHGPP